ncbi:MAG: SPOR domain-containing protein [Blastocatellia bacterium]|nr:SPOR domain-containing protein [Blastocatellia bacterium]
MYSKRAILSALFLILLLSLASRSSAGGRANLFTIQVAAFQDMESAQVCIAGLTQAGEQPVWGMVELPGRGTWIRIMVGEFLTFAEARRYGKNLLDRGVIKEFLVRPASTISSLGRPRSISSMRSGEPEDGKSAITPATSPSPQPISLLKPTGHSDEARLPAVRAVKLSLNALVDTSFIPRPDPVRLAFEALTRRAGNRGSRPRRQGGFWISGDIEEAFNRLEWIAGEESAKCLSLDERGRVELNVECLAQTIGIDHVSPLAAPLIAADYIASNEGLLLLVQLTEGDRRYRLHLGQQTPTFGGEVTITGSLNLDNNYDSRINPYRRSGNKLTRERPPEGFDALVALNPVARWFNLRTNQPVPVSHITFHELAEAYAKVEWGLDYLKKGERPGAHDVALEREMRLKAQRPRSGVVVTVGSNRLLKSEEEARRFYAESGISINDQR